MAPEQALATEIGPWTDLYSVGVIAYELFVGQLPFGEADTPMSILWKHVHEPAPPPSSRNPSLDPRLAAWIEQLLAKQPALRPQTAAEAWGALEEISVDLLGERWRREAALPGDLDDAAVTPRALDPTPPATPRGQPEAPPPAEALPPPERPAETPVATISRESSRTTVGSTRSTTSIPGRRASPRAHRHSVRAARSSPSTRRSSEERAWTTSA
jgi:serine/threonine protein kinase